MAEDRNIDLVLNMVSKMCGELTDKGQEYFLVTASSTKTATIGSTKGRQFLEANEDVMQRFLKHCYGSSSTIGTQTVYDVTQSPVTKRTSKYRTPKPADESPQNTEKQHSTRSKGLSNSDVNTRSVSQEKTKQDHTQSVKETRRSGDKPASVVPPDNDDGDNDVMNLEMECVTPDSDSENEQTEITEKEQQPNTHKAISRNASSPEKNTVPTSTTKSPFSMSLRANRKRKVFADCEVESPVKLSNRGDPGDAEDLLNDSSTNDSPRKRGRPRKSDQSTKRSAESSEDVGMAKVSRSDPIQTRKQRSSSVGVILPPVKIKLEEETNAEVDKNTERVGAASRSSLGGRITGRRSVHKENDRGKKSDKKKTKSDNRKSKSETDFSDDCSQDDDDDDEMDKTWEASEKTDKTRSPKGKLQKPCYICSICNLTFKNAGGLSRHSVSHNLQCDGCQEEFPDRQSVTAHRRKCEKVREKTKNQVYACEKCGLVCTARWALRRHQLSSHEWRCNFCKVSFKSEEEMEQHMETCIDRAVKLSEKAEKIRNTHPEVCPTCGKRFANKGVLSCHMRSHKSNDKKLISEICGISVEQVDNIVENTEIQENQTSNDTDGELVAPSDLKCQSCGNYCDTQLSLSQHKKVCLGKKKYACETCKKSFVMRCELNKHVKNYHPETYSMRALYKSKPESTGERIQCKYCNKGSFNIAWMIAHEKMHVKCGDKLLKRERNSTSSNIPAESDNNQTEEHSAGNKKDGDPKRPPEVTGQGSTEVTVQGSTEVETEPMPEDKDTSSKDKSINIKEEAQDTEDGEVSTETGKEESSESGMADTAEGMEESRSPQKGGSLLLSSLKCKICNSTFKNKQDLYDHAAAHREYKCTIEGCGKILSSSGTLKKHLSIAHSEKRDFICEQCGKAFKTKRCVKQHIFKVHEKETEDDQSKAGPHACKICGKVFLERRLLTKHMYYHKERTAACPVCEKCFPGRGEMLYHLKHVHSDARNYSCDKCNKQYKTMSSLREHRHQHHEGRQNWRFPCPHCPRVYHKQCQLNYHMKIHTGDKPYSCEHCGLKFTQKGNLHKHLQTVHIKQVEYTCDLCGKEFYLNENFKFHMRTHAVENGTAKIVGDKYGPIPHCDICGKFFARVTTYNAHMRLHRGEWKFKCPLCKKMFVSVTACTRHLKTHLQHKMTSSEIRDKFPLEIADPGTPVEIDAQELKKDYIKKKQSPTRVKVPVDGRFSKSILGPTRAMKSSLKASLKDSKTALKYPHREKQNDSPSKVITVVRKGSPGSSSATVVRNFTEESVNAASLLESLAGGGIETDMAEVHLEVVTDDDQTAAIMEEVVEEKVIVEQENASNVVSVDGEVSTVDGIQVLQEHIDGTEEMSASDLNEILEKVNSEEFLEHLGSGNVLLVQQGDTKAYIMLN